MPRTYRCIQTCRAVNIPGARKCVEQTSSPDHRDQFGGLLRNRLKALCGVRTGVGLSLSPESERELGLRNAGY